MGQDDLRRVLDNLPPSVARAGDLLVGHSTNDDAAVFRIDGSGRAIVQTVDFFTPIVDDPELFGEIAAANSVSDIYAMGAEPIFGLAIAAFPTKRLPLDVLEAILRGGARKAEEAGFPIAGGHTIIDDVPKYGLVVTGVVDESRIIRNSTARAGDLLYLTKPLGNGILVSAHRGTGLGLRRLLHRKRPSLDQAVHWMTMLNRGAAAAMQEAGASAATDVTGYGFLGHLLEICKASGTGARISFRDVPLLDGVGEWLDRGFFPDGSKRNMEAYAPRVSNRAGERAMRILSDAQTSGGLLICIAPEQGAILEAAFRRDGLFCAKLGELTGEAARIEIHP